MPGGSRVFEMARRLSAAGHLVHVITSYREPKKEKAWILTQEGGFDIHWMPVTYHNTMSFQRRILSFFRFAFTAAKKAASLKADVVFATSTPLTICLPGTYAAKRQRIPRVFEVRDLWPEMPIAVGALRNPFVKCAARKLERFAYRNATRVVALSPGMADGVAATGYPRDKIHVIPNSCDMDRFKSDSAASARFHDRYPELGSGPIILYAGTMGRVNEVTYLVRMAKEMRERNPEVEFVVFGEGSEEEATRTLAEELGVLNLNYHQFGRIPKELVVDAFLAADVVTSLFAPIPEMEKNSANKFFDGLATGKPVAINYGGWQADLLNETGAGLVLDRDPEAAAKQLADFISVPDKVANASHAARKLAEERFSRDKLAKELEQVLHCAVEEFKPRNTRKRV
ncbi:MAG: glycosyltransferase family 4 protein [Kiritimatiellae bacterium]|nr:glycosyltransferase family 4 protein [Kiritimatiellia bacterium]